MLGHWVRNSCPWSKQGVQLPSFLGWVIVGFLFVFSWGAGVGVWRVEEGGGWGGDGWGGGGAWGWGGVCFYHGTEKIDGC